MNVIIISTGSDHSEQMEAMIARFDLAFLEQAPLAESSCAKASISTGNGSPAPTLRLTKSLVQAQEM